MGLFKFIKDAGATLFGGGAQAATPDALKKAVESHRFDANKLNINMEGDKVKLSGQAMTQEEAEKIILSLGNTIGVAEVDTSELQVQQPAQQSTVYTVQKGDTPLSKWRAAMPESDKNLPENSQENLDRKLDHAVKETFPTSDPVSVTITKGGAIDYDENGKPITGEQAQASGGSGGGLA